MLNISTLQKKVIDAIQKVNSSTENIFINKTVEDIVKDITSAEYSSIWIHEDQSLIREREEDKLVTISMKKKIGLLYRCFATKKATIYNHLSSEEGYSKEVDNPDKIEMKSKIMIPLVDNEKFIGIVTAYSSFEKNRKFTKKDLEILEAIIPLVTSAIYKMQLNKKGFVQDRRVHATNPTKYKRRDNDIIENLVEIEESQSENKSSKEMLEYLSNTVHDIRTPSNGLFGFLEILEEQIEDKRLKNYVNHAKNSALLINELTTSILDGVSYKKNSNTQELQTVNTAKYFADIANVFSATMYKKNLNYNIFIDPLVPKEIEINSMKIKRVIMNLLGNASKFTPQYGSIEFSVRYKDKEKKLHIFIKDNGIGIAKEKQEKVFEAFEQATQNTSKIYGGTGLGLAISANYLKELNSKLNLDSELNRGSIFYFDIPITVKDSSLKHQQIKNKNINISILSNKKNLFTANHIGRYFVKIGINVDKIIKVETLQSVSDKTTHIVVFESKLSDELYDLVKEKNIELLVIEENYLALKSKDLKYAFLASQYTCYGQTLYTFVSDKVIPRVLIAEDDKISQTLLKAMLKNEYCEIDIAQNGEEGLEMLKNALYENDPYTLVYTDQSMPILSGDEMLESYKKLDNKELCKTKSVSISGNTTKKTLYDYDYYATKPFKKQEIVKIFLDAIS